MDSHLPADHGIGTGARTIFKRNAQGPGNLDHDLGRGAHHGVFIGADALPLVPKVAEILVCINL